MRVIATKVGFFGGRRRIGQEFDLPESACKKKDGKPVLPLWVVEATDANREKLKSSAAFETKKAREAALASAGPKRKEQGFASAAPSPEEEV